MSDTPEIDAAEVVFSPLEGDKWVRADIVRKLERKYNAAIRDRDESYKLLLKENKRLKLELDKWTEP